MVDKQHKKLETRTPLLEVKDFSVAFRQYEQGLREIDVQVIHQLDVTIYPGEIVAVVGASGSGKSLLADAILGILPEHATTKGEIFYDGSPLTRKRQHALRGKEIALIPQSVNALDPLMKTGKQVQAVIGGRGSKKRVVQEAAFRDVGLPKGSGQLYPFELSGGMTRRVLATTAMVSDARLIIADEPTPGLDPLVLEETIHQLKQLITAEKGMMFITHDIDVALKMADRIVVFYGGKTVEIAETGAFSGEGELLQHPYTRALWHALPQNAFAANPSVVENTSPGKGKQGSEKHVATSKHTGIQADAGQAGSGLEMKGLSFHYPGQPWLFQDVHLTIKPGEIVGLFGYSGSGKSTLAQVISGYKQPLAGKITADGAIPQPNGVHPVQLVWQHPEKAINPRWRLKKLLEERPALGPELLETLGIQETWLSRWPSELSGGELQRFCLARALAGGVRYIIADEITTMLDAVTQAHIWQTMRDLVKTRGIGVLAISHDRLLLERVADRIIDFNELSGVHT